ncbi:MAG: hypothetical protein D6682_08320 [Zetaproteobacteria bacterium]|nr:MAG: hypothetical protein D6682_08320 [Zetaproteobacteria bacterium]
MKPLFQRIVRHAWPVLALLALATMGFVSQLPRLTMETNIEEMLPKTMEAYINKKELERRFASADMVVIGIENPGADGIYNPHTLKLVDELTQWLRTRKEFRTIALSDLMSLATIKDIRGTAGGMEVERFMERPATTKEAIDHLRRRLRDNGIYMGSIVSADGKGTLIVVRPAPEMVGHYYEIYQLIRKKVAEIRARGGPERIYITGRPIVEGVFGVYMPQSMQKMQPLVLGLLALLLFAAFRNLRGVLIPLTVVVLSELWMLGTMAAVGVPIYTVTTLLPILILAIGIADSVHLLTHIRVEAARDPTADRSEVIVRGMAGMWMPILMTTLTTAAGFLAMLTSQLLPMRYFGIFAAIGILYAFVITILFIPAVEAVLPGRERPLDAMAFSGYLRWMSRTVVEHPRRIAALFALLLLLSGYGLSRIHVNSSLISEFRPSDPLRQTDAMINRHFAGTNSLDLMIDSGREDGVLQPAFLAGMARLQALVERDPVVGDSTSVAEFLAEMNKVMHGGDPRFKTTPDNARLAAQYMLLYSFSGAPDDFDSMVTSDYRRAHIRIQMKSDNSADAVRLIDAIERHAPEWFPGSRIKFAGTAYTTDTFSDLVIKGQIESLLLALLAIFLLCYVMFRRVGDALLAMLPVSIAVVVIYGIMGLVGLPLEIGTAVTGAMALGIGVDFAIHYLYRFRDYQRRGMPWREIVFHANDDTGRALLFNALVVVGGFLVLLTAPLYPQVKLGALVAGSMILCYLASCYLFPVLLRREAADPASSR